jgi:energy-coupling factor transporter ATP-binding protein EcfA2
MLQVNFQQALNLIRTVGQTNTLLFLGQPGVGKSALLHAAAQAMPDYHPCYIDCATLDIGDLGLPMIDREEGVTGIAPNSRFGLGRSQSKPVLGMLDELTKPSSKAVMNMLLPTVLEKRLMDRYYPAGSIFFATGNLMSDNVGDMLPAHAWSRMTVVDFRNPTSDEWITDYAIPAGLAPEVILFAKEHPEAFQRYDELGERQTNPLIFNPRTGNTRAYCAARPLAKASPIIAARAQLGDAFLPALAGTVGEPAARLIDANVALNAKLPSLASVAANPQSVRLPEDVSQYFLMALKMAYQSNDKTLAPFAQYALRWDAFEASHLFAASVAGNPKTASLQAKCREFMELAAKHGRYV